MQSTRWVGTQGRRSTERDQLQEAAQPLLTASPMAEFGALATTLHMDVDPGPISEEAGWRQFVRGTLPQDPRDCWKAP